MTTALETVRSGFDPFLAMDKLDDEAILAELKGRILDKWTYHFSQDGKEIWGLSKVGVDQACAEMAKRGEVIRELSLTFQPDPTDSKYMLFVAMAARYAVSKDGKEVFLDQTVGTKRQGVKMPNSDKPNNFFFEQGAMKAFRNARMRMISEETRAKIIALSKEQGKVHDIKGAEIVEPGGNQEAGEPEITDSDLTPTLRTKINQALAMLCKTENAEPMDILKKYSGFVVNGKRHEAMSIDGLMKSNKDGQFKWAETTYSRMRDAINGKDK